MNKFIFATVLFALLGLALETSALQCYECAPTKDCANNFSNNVKDCSKDIISQGASYITSQKMVCAKFGIGEYITRGCFVDGVCNDKTNCATCDSDLCNSADSKRISTVVLSFAPVMVVLCKLFF